MSRLDRPISMEVGKIECNTEISKVIHIADFTQPGFSPHYLIKSRMRWI